MRDFVRKRSGLGCYVRLAGPNLDLSSLGRTSRAIETAFLDESHGDPATLCKSQQPIQHLLPTFPERLGWQVRQWRAVSLRDIEHVNDFEPDSLDFRLGAVCRLPLVLEEHRGEDCDSLLALADVASKLQPVVEACDVARIWLLSPDQELVMPGVIPECC